MIHYLSLAYATFHGDRNVPAVKDTVLQHLCSSAHSRVHNLCVENVVGHVEYGFSSAGCVVWKALVWVLSESDPIHSTTWHTLSGKYCGSVAW